MHEAVRSERAVVLDVDGVISPVHGHTAWGDDVVGGHVFGPAFVSPTMCARIDRLSRMPGLQCWWLTTWSASMRAAADPFPGSDWPVIADGLDVARGTRGWGKLDAVEAWLPTQPSVKALAWCDDHLRGGRPAAVRRRLTALGVAPLLIAPRTSVGLTPTQLERLERWAQEDSAEQRPLGVMDGEAT